MPPKKTIPYKKVEELYNDGLNDREIADQVGCNKISIFIWRRENKLKPNSRIPMDCEEHDPESLFKNKKFVEKLTGCKLKPCKIRRFWK
jgi:hypothetical protein